MRLISPLYDILPCNAVANFQRRSTAFLPYQTRRSYSFFKTYDQLSHLLPFQVEYPARSEELNTQRKKWKLVKSLSLQELAGFFDTESKLNPRVEVQPISRNVDAKLLFNNEFEEAWAELHLPYPSFEVPKLDRVFLDLIIQNALQKGMVIWDGGAGNLNFAINLYHEALKNGFEIRAIIASNINKVSLTRGAIAVRSLALERKIAVGLANISEAPTIVGGNFPKLYVFKDVLSILGHAQVELLLSHLANNLQKGELAALTYPVAVGTHFDLFNGSPATEHRRIPVSYSFSSREVAFHSFSYPAQGNKIAVRNFFEEHNFPKYINKFGLIVHCMAPRVHVELDRGHQEVFRCALITKQT